MLYIGIENYPAIEECSTKKERKSLSKGWSDSQINSLSPLLHSRIFFFHEKNRSFHYKHLGSFVLVAICLSAVLLHSLRAVRFYNGRVFQVVQRAFLLFDVNQYGSRLLQQKENSPIKLSRLDERGIRTHFCCPALRSIELRRGGIWARDSKA